MRQVIIGDYNKKIALSITDNAFPGITEELLGSYLPKIALYFYTKFFGTMPLDLDTFNIIETQYILIHKLEIYSSNKVCIICSIHNNTPKPEGWRFIIDLQDREKIRDYTFLEYTVYDKIEKLPPKIMLPKTFLPKRVLKKIEIQAVNKIESSPVVSAPKILSFAEKFPLLNKTLQGAFAALIISTILASFITALIFSGGTVIIPTLLISTYSISLNAFSIVAIAVSSVLGITALGAGIGLIVGWYRKNKDKNITEATPPSAEPASEISTAEPVKPLPSDNPLLSEPAAFVGPATSIFKLFQDEPLPSPTLEQFKKEVLKKYGKPNAINLYAGSAKNEKFNNSCYVAFENDIRRKDGKFANAVVSVLNDPAFKNFDKELLQEVPALYDWLNVRSGICTKLK